DEAKQNVPAPDTGPAACCGLFTITGLPLAARPLIVPLTAAETIGLVPGRDLGGRTLAPGHRPPLVWASKTAHAPAPPWRAKGEPIFVRRGVHDFSCYRASPRPPADAVRCTGRSAGAVVPAAVRLRGIAAARGRA